MRPPRNLRSGSRGPPEPFERASDLDPGLRLSCGWIDRGDESTHLRSQSPIAVLERLLEARFQQIGVAAGREGDQCIEEDFKRTRGHRCRLGLAVMHRDDVQFVAPQILIEWILVQLQDRCIEPNSFVVADCSADLVDYLMEVIVLKPESDEEQMARQEHGLDERREYGAVL